MAGETGLVVNCPYCGKACSCRLQSRAGTSWFTCPHCRTKRFYVQVTVGREATQTASPRPEQAPALRCLTEEFDWNNPQDFVRFAQAYEEDLATLARLKPGPAVTAAKKQLETMRFAVRNIEGTRMIQAGVVGLAMLPQRMEQAGRTASAAGGARERATSSRPAAPSGDPRASEGYKVPCAYCRTPIEYDAHRCPYCAKDRPHEFIQSK